MWLSHDVRQLMFVKCIFNLQHIQLMMGFWGSNPIGNWRACPSWKRKQSWSSIFLLFHWDTATAFWFVCFPLNYFRKNNNASKTRNSNYQLDLNVSMYKFWPCIITIVKLSKHCDNRHTAPSMKYSYQKVDPEPN